MLIGASALRAYLGLVLDVNKIHKAKVRLGVLRGVGDGDEQVHHVKQRKRHTDTEHCRGSCANNKHSGLGFQLFQKGAIASPI